MPENNILKTIGDLWYGEQILKFCVQPRTTSEIRNAFKKWKESDNSAWLASSFADHLTKLEKMGAIEYSSDNKWQTTEETAKLVKKYFG